jgi:sugar lactone lactonase YvrE
VPIRKRIATSIPMAGPIKEGRKKRSGVGFTSRVKVALRLFRIGTSLAISACNPGPLPAENPKTKLDEPVDVVPVIFESSSATDAASPSAGHRSASDRPTRIMYRGLAHPESVVHDTQWDRYLVSNINGTATAHDNNGFISILDPEGGVAKPKFIAGSLNGVTLNGPKGMAIYNGSLFVADIDQVRIFDLDTGQPKGSVAITEGSFVNDVAVSPDGQVIVTDSGLVFDDKGQHDTGSASIHRFPASQRGGSANRIASASKTPTPTAFGNPNGVAFLGNDLLVSGFSSNWLHQLDAEGNVRRAARLPRGELDGIVVLSSSDLLVSSWQAKTVYRGNLETGFSAIGVKLDSPADIAVDQARQRLIIPTLKGNSVLSIPLSRPSPSKRR